MAISNLGVFAIAIVIGFVFTRYNIVKAINRLAAAAAVLAAGNFGHRVAVTSKDEIGNLQNAFNQMASDLRQTHERLTLAQSHSAIALWDCAIAANLIYLSEGWSRLLGEPREPVSVSIDAYFERIHRADVDAVRQSLAALLNGTAPAYAAEYRVSCLDGSWKWIFGDGKVVERGTDGRPARAIGTNIDITYRKLEEEKLRKTERFLESIVEHIPDAVLVKDAKTLSCVLINRAGKNIYEIVGDNCIGDTYQDWLPARQAALLFARDREVLATKQPLDIPQETLTRRDGSERVVHTEKIAIFDAGGNAEYLLTLLHDITDANLAERALRASEERFRLIAENVSDLIAVVDTEGKRIYSSPSYRAMLGDDVLPPGSDSFSQIHRDDREGVIQLFNESVKSGQGRRAQFRFILPDGDIRFIESRGNVVRNDSSEVDRVVVVSRDVTERLSADERLRYLAHHDLLTDLPNRVLMRDRIEQGLMQAERSNTRVAVMFLDLDHFKNVNDLHGHSVGDQLLRELAQRLRRRVRSSDTISRQGGDEFVIFLPNLPMRAAAVSVAESILDAFSRPFMVGNHTLEVGASIGISVFREDGTDVETLLRNADTAMYEAKQSGRAGYQFFNAELEQAVRLRVDMGTRLRNAIGLNEFRLEYQPRINLATGEISSTEALVRWQHPEMGLIGPTQFIAYAEESGLIINLGKWILAEACRQNEAWRRSGYPDLVVAVNVSGRQFRQHGFVSLVAAILTETGMPAEALELELTETVFMQEAEHTKTRFKELRALGVKLAIDDFGTGYSNLSYLKRFGVDRLKIDQSFIRDVATDPNDAAIVDAILAVARSLRIEVTAEGVETEMQANYLRSRGCSEAQGYLYSRPLPAIELERQLQHWCSQEALASRQLSV